jgi:hypothetical protein
VRFSPATLACKWVPSLGQPRRENSGESQRNGMVTQLKGPFNHTENWVLTVLSKALVVLVHSGRRICFYLIHSINTFLYTIPNTSITFHSTLQSGVNLKDVRQAFINESLLFIGNKQLGFKYFYFILWWIYESVNSLISLMSDKPFRLPERAMAKKEKNCSGDSSQPS